ncbi:hypothetical protein P170DRAFT_448460 [Aspergillus steynii IBT 23096]|uniref:Uncharacterized protein n=1 Tax=Aspergillus steynii IBT 23096 TaxID=1392250 RepID=A0A2I2G188_9EURO|nr:uncharacterized protein P170DRAFT_448460 [Aspergillus steynii IBT 23096]PLB46643.1 hypothetical protein P170DRAFT_448460 [Aspergillus steynii IBT 23096]
MAHLRGGDRPFASIHNLLKMLLSPHQSNKPVQQDADMAEDVDEPPDHRFLNTSSSHVDEDVVRVKTTVTERQESLLTRALKTSPVLSPSEQEPSSHEHTFYRSYHYTNISLTSPSLSNTSSPPLPSRLNDKPAPVTDNKEKKTGQQAGESAVEANLGRKRCISFACGRKAEEQKVQPPTPQRPAAKNPETNPTPTSTEPVKRKTVLTFVCPARDPETRRERSPARAAALKPRPRGSPAPVARKASPENKTPLKIVIPEHQEQQPSSDRRGVPTSGLGKFEESEATRFHEFASSVEEDDEWVTKSADYKEKITLNDCMKKENAIRKLGEEAEEEALDDEEEDDDDDDEDEDDDDEDDDGDSTIHDISSDDGNESDNEAGFADSDESDGSEYEFWAPATTTAATSPQTLDLPRPTFPRRDSNTSFDSLNDDNKHRRWPPALSEKGGSRPTKIPKMRPSTPHLPDSTDFVCGTFDEDRPLEAAYKSCMEQRRLSKQILIPQDIDPSFPTSDPEEEDEEDEEDDVPESLVVDEAPRGRAGLEQARKPSPRGSPKRMISPPPPRRNGRVSPRRLRSPPPPMKLKSPTKGDRSPAEEAPSLRPQGLNISELVQRPHMTRTKSLPRTPNPFFMSLDKSHKWPGVASLGDSSDCDSRTREIHTRGPIDIVEGLEKKRQKRKEKFWRQHCRKAAKEQMERRRPVPGKGAERMKDLGLAVAERCRAYGVGENAQLVLSV